MAVVISRHRRKHPYDVRTALSVYRVTLTSQVEGWRNFRPVGKKKLLAPVGSGSICFDMGANKKTEVNR